MDAPADLTRVNSYFTAQRQFRRPLGDRPALSAPNQPDPRWLISDLVTFGSPLTHAEFLIAIDHSDLEARKAARELPQSPPYRESVDPNVLHRAEAKKVMPFANAQSTRLMSYRGVNRANTWMLHHAGRFVGWPNVFDPAILVFFGDVIGGPLAPVCGPAIVD